MGNFMQQKTGKTAAPSYTALESVFEDSYLVSSSSELLNWDMQVMMPPAGVVLRGRQMGKLNEIAHGYIAAGATGDLIAQADEEQRLGLLTPWQEANLRLMKRRYLRETALTPMQVRRMTELRAVSSAKWQEARDANDFGIVRDAFADLLAIVRETAAARGAVLGLSAYDALVDEYDPGSTAARIDGLFAPLVKSLPGLLTDAVAAQKQRPPLTPTALDATPEALTAFLRDIIGNMGFDFNAGRLDLTPGHPFASGGPGDARVLSFHRGNDAVFPVLVSIHEIGHALYEGGCDPRLMTQPAGAAGSMGMGMHESQALFFEKMLGRTEAFWHYARNVAQKHFTLSAGWTPGNLLNSVTTVTRNPSRTSSDEICYTLHIIMRYQLEKQLIDGTLALQDLPEAWNNRMKELIGIDPGPDLSKGCLQDIHWYDAAFGYFPAYVVGLMYAVQIFDAIRSAAPDLSGQMAAGNFTAVNGWLQKNIYAHAAQYPAPELIRRATGRDIDPQDFIAHLRARYT